jgi:uncharacterized membrane protein YfcA
MELFWVSLAALLASCLTFFSGFGLGTLLMPVVALFLPVEVAIAVTAIVHLANNLFKLALVGKKADCSVVWRFGAPAVLAALLGAWLLNMLSGLPTLFEYQWLGREFAVSVVKFIIGVLILAFVWLELSPRFAKMSFDARYLPLGGALSGFFGGLSGHQGAFRSMFLIKSGLDSQRFIATGVVLAVLVDVARMLVYGWSFSANTANVQWTMVLSASFSAFVGAYLGAKLLHKVTLRTIQRLVSVLLVLIGLGLVTGLL